MTKTPALWIPGTPEAPQHRPAAATQTSATPGTWRNTQAATSLPGSLAAQSPSVALHTTPGTQSNTQLATSPPASPAQSPTMGLQTSPWLDEPPGATSAQPAAVRATSGPVPAQHIRATAMAGEKSYLKTGEENQAAQATFSARTMPGAPAAVTAPSTRHPSPLPAPTAAVPPAPTARAPSPPRGDVRRQPEPPPEGTERGTTLQPPQIASPWGRDKDSSVSGWSERRQDQEIATIPNLITLGSASRNHFSKPRIVGGKLAAFTLLADSDAFIPCEATGNPLPIIQWTKISSGELDKPL